MPVQVITGADIDTPVIPTGPPVIPTGPQVSDILPGTERRGSPFTEGQSRDAGFAFRMEDALRTIEEIEESGFNPANFRDLLIDYLGGDAGTGPRAWVERLMLSPKYKQYQRAKMDFSTSQLRKETGAVINESEIAWVDNTYFPLLSAPEGERLDKWAARRAAVAAMKVSGGAAYEDVRRLATSSPAGTDTQGSALDELRRRAETDEALAAELRNMGLL